MTKRDAAAPKKAHQRKTPVPRPAPFRRQEDGDAILAVHCEIMFYLTGAESTVRTGEILKKAEKQLLLDAVVNIV